MVTIKQISEGIARYVDLELASKVPGLKKWLLALAALKASSIIEDTLSKHIDKAVKIGYAQSDGMIDLDALFNDLFKIANDKGSVTEHITLIGDITFNIEDLQKLKNYIE